MALIKIIKIKQIVDALIEFVKNDYNNATNKQESFLYRMLGDNTEGDYNFYEQSLDIFLRDDLKARRIKTSLMFNKNTNGSPHIHVREASRTKGQFNTIGGTQGESFGFENGSFGQQYRDTKKGIYEILVTSLDPLDTILISEVIYTLMYGAHATLQDEFSLFDFSLKELVFQNSTAEQLYVKSITLDTQQENFIPSIITEGLASKINFTLTHLEDTEITS